MKSVIEDYQNGFINECEMVMSYKRALEQLHASEDLDKAINDALRPLTYFIVDMFNGEVKRGFFDSIKDWNENQEILRLMYDDAYSKMKDEINEHESNETRLGNMVKDLDGEVNELKRKLAETEQKLYCANIALDKCKQKMDGQDNYTVIDDRHIKDADGNIYYRRGAFRNNR